MRYTKAQRKKIIKTISESVVDTSVLETPLADFLPVNEKQNLTVKKFTQNLLDVCCQSNVSHEVVVASLALALFSSVSTSYNLIPNPSNLIH